MFAVIESGGKQYRVEPEQTIQVEKIAGESGDKIVLDRVLMLKGKGKKDLFIGTPLVQDATVEGQILNQMQDKKVTVFKMKRRKGYHKKQGHRQQITTLKITDIKAPKKK